MLFPADHGRLIINGIPKRFDLASRMNGRAFSRVSVLVHDQDDITVLGRYNSPNGAKGYVQHTVIVNAFDLYRSISVAMDNSNIASSNTTISTTVDQ